MFSALIFPLKGEERKERLAKMEEENQKSCVLWTEQLLLLKFKLSLEFRA